MCETERYAKRDIVTALRRLAELIENDIEYGRELFIKQWWPKASDVDWED